MNKRIIRKEKGITLIALIITIVILIILAGISINLLIGENGLIGRAKKGSDIYSEQQAKEKLELLLADMQVDKIDNKEYNQNEYLTSKIEENEMTVNGDIVFVNGWQFEIDRSVPKISASLGKGEGEENHLIADYKITDGDIEKGSKLLTLKNSGTIEINASANEIDYTQDSTGLVFNGINSCATIDKFTITYPVTFSFAVKWENGVDNIIFYDKNSKIGIGTYQNKLLLSAINYSYYYNLPSDFYTNDVNYITVVYNTSETDNKVYINGKEISKSSSSDCWSRTETETMYLGRRPSGSFFKGIIYEFNIYNSLFTQAEAEQSYKEMLKRKENGSIEDSLRDKLLLQYNSKENENDPKVTLVNRIKNKINRELDITGYRIQYNQEENCAVFDGINSYGLLDKTKLDITYPVSISMVVNWKKPTDGCSLIFMDVKSKIGIGIWNTNYMILQYDIYSNAKWFKLPSDFYTNNINYITISYQDINNPNLYINGQKIEVATTGNGWIYDETETYIGRRKDGNYFNGRLYNFKIYDKLLNEQEIIEQYQIDKAKYEK